MVLRLPRLLVLTILTRTPTGQTFEVTESRSAPAMTDMFSWQLVEYEAGKLMLLDVLAERTNVSVVRD
ncbi:hypothetical protein BC835DRAFT_1371961, partial [Cytidiella melzeri]